MDTVHGGITGTSLVVGITGHRNLRDSEIPEIREKIRHFFLELRQRYPALPITLLSSLAAGSDQVVAQVAFDMGIRVIAPLPVSPELYRDDFEQAHEAELFERQLACAETLQLTLLPGSDPTSVIQPGIERNMQYAQAGIFTSSHCHILLALWDGRESSFLGGTAQVVSFHLHGDMPGPIERRRAALGTLGLDEETLVYHIPVNRQNAADVETGLGRWLTSDQGYIYHDTIPPGFDQMLRRHAEFNNDWLQYSKTIEADTADSAGKDECPIHRLFRVADWLAATYQHRVSRILMITYLLTALMGFAFIFYSDVAAQDVMIYLFLLFFLAGIGVNSIAGRREWHRKYIDYRALAEGLRVQSFWRRAGVADSSRPSFEHDNFLQKQDVQLGWIRNIMRAASLDGMLSPVNAGIQELEAVVEEWIGTADSPGQLSYYAETSLKRTRTHRRNELLAASCLWLGISISVVLAIFARGLQGNLQNLMVATMGVLSVAAAVHEAYAYKKADKELIKQYRFMLRIFTAASRRLSTCHDFDEKRQILHTLGEAALAEHAEWTLMHRERPLEQSKL